MKISYGWLKTFVPGLPEPRELARHLSMAGLGVESLKPWTSAMEGIVVGEVLAREKHPNADRLSLCVVEAGGERYSVVCGAPNVVAGMKAPFALVGARLPGGKTIQAATIRGVASHGMLCSQTELGLGADASGIMSLPASAVTGEPFVPNPEDWIFDLEVTPNRGDLLSVLGVARQLSATLSLPWALPWPVPGIPDPAGGTPWRVTIADPAGCGLYTARLLTGVKVGPSPEWMQKRLAACGLRPINNVVDITNYLLLETGHPLHAFDAAKLSGQRIDVRRAAAGDKLKTLDGVDRPLNLEVLVIADGAGAVAAAGIMGGASSEIGPGTHEVLLEAAWFDPVRTRRGARSLGLSTEASYRFERGVDPGGVVQASDRAAQLMVELAGATVGSPLLRAEGTLPVRRPIEVRASDVSSLLGVALEASQLKTYAERMQAAVEGPRGDVLAVTPPSWRLDVNIPADLAEEFATIHGYDRVPATLPKREAAAVPEAKRVVVVRRIREALRAAGMSEAQTLSMIAKADLARLGLAVDGVTALANPLNEDLGILRPTLLAGLLRAAGYNLAREAAGVRLFEIGAIFGPPDASGIPVEGDRLALVVAGRLAADAFDAERALDLADLKGAVASATAALGLAIEWTAAAGAPFSASAAAELRLAGRVVGRAGVLAPGTAAAYEIPAGAVAAEIELAALVEAAVLAYAVEPPARFPAVRRDLALVVAEAVGAAALEAAVREAGKPLLESAAIFDCYRGKQIPEGTKSLAVRLAFRAPDRTLTEPEADEAVRAIVAALGERLSAKLR
ncbi:MAG: phenylalanine--tRNA ligase subunit beta [Candidatus Coatesbacteria bacterium]